MNSNLRTAEETLHLSMLQDVIGWSMIGWRIPCGSLTKKEWGDAALNDARWLDAMEWTVAESNLF
ncbi:MAG TPA: hypothetical protein VHT24_11260 [Pseudacidobacterium sp.]|nr:hypothetical protein [Pseudacidobacterium sp.]